MRSSILRIVYLLSAAWFVVGFVGCGPKGTRGDLVPVSGRVFLDDEPLKFGTVIFQPSSGQPARGVIDAEGKFVLSTFHRDDGAKVGKHNVRVLCYSNQDPKGPTKGEIKGDSLGDLLIPAKYTNFSTSGLEVFVVAGGNSPFLLKLESESAEESAQESDSVSAGDEEDGTVDSESQSGEASEPVSDSSDAVPADSVGPQ